MIDHPATFGYVWSVLGRMYIEMRVVDVFSGEGRLGEVVIQWPDPDGAVEVTARPGDAVIFDRRIWHTRSRNHSQHTRKAAFFGYTYRWTAIRDDIAPIRARDWLGRLNPVQQQLLGSLEDPGGDHAWGHHPETTPLYGWLKERGLLDPANPPLKP